RMTRAFFEATTTFGVRRTNVRRAELVRQVVGVSLEGGEVRVKVGLLGGRVMSATPEHDDVAELARRIGRPARGGYEEAVAAARVAAMVGVEHRVVETAEVAREAYARNDGLRCFHCKTELYATLGRLAPTGGRPGVTLLAGANADDEGDYRPGLRAGELRGVRNPLLEEEIAKPMVRAMARHLALPVADKPALACLSSRVAFGMRITPALLARVDAAERRVRA